MQYTRIVQQLESTASASSDMRYKQRSLTMILLAGKDSLGGIHRGLNADHGHDTEERSALDCRVERRKTLVGGPWISLSYDVCRQEVQLFCLAGVRS